MTDTKPTLPQPAALGQPGRVKGWEIALAAPGQPGRVKGWEIALADVVEQHAQTPFAWGRSDCLTLVFDASLALTGNDPMAPYRGKYQSGGGAARVLKSAGFVDIGAGLAAHFEEVGPALARRGDCGLVETVVRGKTVLAAVVITGAEVVGKSPPGKAGGTGLSILSRDRLVRAFKIGW